MEAYGEGYGAPSSELSRSIRGLFARTEDRRRAVLC